MLRYAVRRVLEAVPVTLGVLLLSFLLFHVVGASPAAAILGKNATAEAIAAFNHQWGYDKPILVQFVTFVRGVLGRGGAKFSPLAVLWWLHRSLSSAGE